jgi:hypothetical protein
LGVVEVTVYFLKKTVTSVSIHGRVEIDVTVHCFIVFFSSLLFLPPLPVKIKRQEDRKKRKGRIR